MARRSVFARFIEEYTQLSARTDTDRTKCKYNKSILHCQLLQTLTGQAQKQTYMYILNCQFKLTLTGNALTHTHLLNCQFQQTLTGKAQTQTNLLNCQLAQTLTGYTDTTVCPVAECS